MQTSTSHIPAHLLAILAGKGPSIAHAAPVVQARSTQRAERFTQQQTRIDAQQWEEIESHELTPSENEGGSITVDNLL